jgi:cytoskeleton protein RodZ
MSADRPADFGSKLRQARERKGVTLREIATRTKISIAVLESLERSEITKLPAGIFSRAFVRSYAKEVGLDPDTTVEEFIGLFPHDSVTAGHPRSDQIEDAELFESDRRVASSVLWILLISIPLAGGVLYLGMAQRASGQRAQSPPSQAAKPTSPEALAARDTLEPTAEGAGRPSPAATGAVQGSGSATPGAASPGLAAVPSTPPVPSPAKDVKDNKDVRDAANVATEGLKIELSARRPVWVSATVDGQKAIGRLLQVGDKEVVDVKRELLLTAGDASAVRMTVNGAEARSLGKNGEVITARVTPANFRDYLLSR